MDKFSHNDYEITGREVLYQGFSRLTRYQLKHRLFKDGWTPEFSREILERPPAVGIMLYDPEKDCIVLIEQFRAGAIAHPKSPWLMEIIAGIQENNESTQAIAEREVLEEAGLKLFALEAVCDYFVSPGASNEYIHLFIGHVHAPSESGSIHGLPHEHEDIRLHVIPYQTAWQMRLAGQFKNAPLLLSMEWLQRNREQLQQIWLKK